LKQLVVARPNRGAHTAIAEATGYSEAGYRTVVDLDLAKFFDQGSSRLLDRMSQRITDRRVLDLVRRMLKAAVVMADGTRVAVEEGTPQAGALLNGVRNNGQTVEEAEAQAPQPAGCSAT
jgi:RNA-directed DNA polymerase